jgi:peptidoglycan hydrolase FlgJ
MNVPLVQAASIRAEEIPLDRLAGLSQLSETQKVAEVARQFESVLLRQMLAEARKGVLCEGLGEEAQGLGIYQDLINHTLADSISRSGMLGLARSLESELTRQTVGRPAPDPGSSSLP